MTKPRVELPQKSYPSAIFWTVLKSQPALTIYAAVLKHIIAHRFVCRKSCLFLQSNKPKLFSTRNYHRQYTPETKSTLFVRGAAQFIT